QAQNDDVFALPIVSGHCGAQLPSGIFAVDEYRRHVAQSPVYSEINQQQIGCLQAGPSGDARAARVDLTSRHGASASHPASEAGESTATQADASCRCESLATRGRTKGGEPEIP